MFFFLLLSLLLPSTSNIIPAYSDRITYKDFLLLYKINFHSKLTNAYRKNDESKTLIYS